MGSSLIIQFRLVSYQVNVDLTNSLLHVFQDPYLRLQNPSEVNYRISKSKT